MRGSSPCCRSMASSDARAPAVTPAAAAGPEGVPDEWRRWLLALALVVPWWLPLLGHASSTFYKEALAALLIGFAGVVTPWPSLWRYRFQLHPLLVAIASLEACLAVQLVMAPEAWGKT